MLRPIRTVAPAVDVLALADVKVHLRVEAGATDEDALITSLIGAATAYLDGYSGILGRCLINQTWKLSLECLERDIDLPFPDVSAVTVKYFDSSNVEQTISSANYQLLEEDEGSEITFILSYVPPIPYLFREDRASVTLTAGYGAAATDVPQAIRQAMLLLIGDWYESRETTQDGRLAQLPFSVDALLAPYKRKSF